MRLKLVVVAFALLASGLCLLARASAQTSTRQITLSVTVLPTKYGLLDGPAPTYPETVNVEVPPNVEVAAYGAAGYVWLSPARWTGDAAVGAAGSISVHLLPTGKDARSRPHIEYAAETGCEGCKESDAGPYFPEAMRSYNRGDNFDGKYPIPIPKGLVVRRVSKTFVTYTLPNENNLRVRGTVFWDPAHYGPFLEVRLTLPPEERALGDFLLKYFADRIVQRFRS